MNKLLILCIAILSYCGLEAKIVETAHFGEIKKHINKDTLVILDIDDTLLIPTQMLGCDEWFVGRLQEREKQGVQKAQGLEETLAEWEAIRHLSKMEIVEAGTEEVVRCMQNEGYTVMGLTTQGLALATRTCLQLKANHIDLLTTAPHKKDECVSVGGHTVLYRNGILFTSGTSKGEALFLLCDKIGYKPKRIVFINDKATHLKDIETVAEKKGVEFIGLRYAYSDARKRAYDPQIANYQFNHSSFAHILTDEEAREQMEVLFPAGV
jgi:hypothetical protein